MSQPDEDLSEPFTTAQSYLSTPSPQMPVNRRIISLPNTADAERNILTQRFTKSPRLSSPASSAMMCARDEAVPLSNGASTVATTTALPPMTVDDEVQAHTLRDDNRVQIQVIDTRLKNMSLSIPETRLAVYFELSDEGSVVKSSSVVHTEQPAKGVEVLCVAQSPADVDYTTEVELKAPRVESKLTNIKCQIVYDPGRDDCVLINRTGRSLYLVNLKHPFTYKLIQPSIQYSTGPGLWGIADIQSNDVVYDCIVKFLLLGRRHIVSIAPQSGATNNERLPERQALDASSATDIATHSPSSPRLMKNLQSNAEKATKNPLLDLKDGDLANIQAPLPTTAFRQEASTYQLRLKTKVSPEGVASVFSCEHSLIPGEMAVKVIDYETEPLSELGLVYCSKLWKQEKDILRKLNHVCFCLLLFLVNFWRLFNNFMSIQTNIVSLMAFDGRLLALHLELLPESLAQGRDSPFSLSDASKIYSNVSSALLYLEQEGIVHNDIKPSNIAYSASRGAVLLDFGIASLSNELSGGGSPWYLPPEFTSSSIRSPAGDIWALGIIMLYVLNKIQYPETMAESWSINEIRKASSAAKKQMMAWLEIIYSARNLLDGTSPIEYATFLMLDENPVSRMKAKGIQNTLDFVQ